MAMLPLSAHSRRRPDPPYRITLVGQEWHVRRPHAALSHAFTGLEQAETFVRKDSGGEAEFVEIVAGSTYMVKALGPAR